MNNPALKKMIISKFANMASLTGSNKIILVTHAGVIAGDLAILPKDSEINSLNSEELIYKIVEVATEEYRSKYFPDYDGPLPDNDGCIALKDARIIVGSKTISLPFITVFYDQIVGITFGHI